MTTKLEAMTARRVRDEKRERVLSHLREWFEGEQDVQIVYAVKRHRTAAGRSVSLFTVHSGRIIDITWHLSQLFGYRIDDTHGGIKVPSYDPNASQAINLLHGVLYHGGSIGSELVEGPQRRISAGKIEGCRRGPRSVEL